MPFRLLAPAVALSLEVGLSPLLFEAPRTEARILVGPSVLDNPETADYLGHRLEVTRLSVAELARARDIIGVICRDALGPQAACRTLMCWTRVAEARSRRCTITEGR